MSTRSEAVGILMKRREALQFENSTQLLMPRFDLVSMHGMVALAIDRREGIERCRQSLVQGEGNE